mmetsp:Transcript_11923/g.38177  ORF Transcript_11923/g.38177 Transcript_11923/m.38177 type:complete len:331 (+) Transcript_11923:633-1625(+)
MKQDGRVLVERAEIASVVERAERPVELAVDLHGKVSHRPLKSLAMRASEPGESQLEGDRVRKVERLRGLPPKIACEPEHDLVDELGPHVGQGRHDAGGHDNDPGVGPPDDRAQAGLVECVVASPGGQLGPRGVVHGKVCPRHLPSAKEDSASRGGRGRGRGQYRRRVARDENVAVEVQHRVESLGVSGLGLLEQQELIARGGRPGHSAVECCAHRANRRAERGQHGAGRRRDARQGHREHSCASQSPAVVAERSQKRNGLVHETRVGVDDEAHQGALGGAGPCARGFARRSRCSCRVHLREGLHVERGRRTNFLAEDDLEPIVPVAGRAK